MRERSSSTAGLLSQRMPGTSELEIEKLIYDGSYWYKKVDILMKEKKRHLEDSMKSRTELKTILDENHNLKTRIKQLMTVIERFNLKDD